MKTFLLVNLSVKNVGNYGRICGTLLVEYWGRFNDDMKLKKKMFPPVPISAKCELKSNRVLIM